MEEKRYLISTPAESTGRQVLRISFAIVLSLLTAGYLLPTTVALIRRHESTLPIFTVNFLLGWTLLGWVVTLVWAFVRPVSDERIVKVSFLD